jgi:hypothetical protein
MSPPHSGCGERIRSFGSAYSGPQQFSKQDRFVAARARAAQTQGMGESLQKWTGMTGQVA